MFIIVFGIKKHTQFMTFSFINIIEIITNKGSKLLQIQGSEL